MIESRTGALLGLGNVSPGTPAQHLIGERTTTCANPRKLSHFLTQFHIRRFGRQGDLANKLLLNQALPRSAGMAELADAADSKSAGTWYLAGSIPVPGTKIPQCLC